MKRFGLALAVSCAVWLGVAFQAEAGFSCDFEACPDDIEVCISNSGEARIYDEIGGCTYIGTGSVKDKDGLLKFKAKGKNDEYGCEGKAKVKVINYDPDTGQCVRKAKVKVGSERRKISTPTPCDCDGRYYYDQN